MSARAGREDHAFHIVPAGDSVLVVEFENRIDPEVNARAVALATALEAAAIAGVRDIVPTYRSVAVFFDPLRTDHAALVERLQRDASRAVSVSDFTDTRPVHVPVCYGGEFGPDLPSLAAFAGITEDEVITLHAAGRYRVFMLGFVPGFAYMGVVDPRIAMPRHETPRLRVPAGSVGIAGVQTGVYPVETPGGWQVIGRTPVKPFDARRGEPFLFKPGDLVRFHAIDAAEFERLR